MATKNKIGLSAPDMGMGELAAVERVLKQGYLGPNSKETEAFEQEFEAFLGKGNGVLALNSGTAALHLALKVLGVGKGSFVLVQSFSFCAPAFAVSYTGAKPVFIDSEEASWNMSPRFLEEALDYFNEQDLLDRVGAIIVVHAYGSPAEMDAIVALSDQYQVPIIEDAAEAIGASYKGRKVGTIGDLAVFSFNANKTLSTGGGGALISKNEYLLTKARVLANQAKSTSPFYKHEAIGYNYAINSIAAAIGREQLLRIDELVAARIKRFAQYCTYLGDKGVLKAQGTAQDSIASRWLSAFRSQDPQLGYETLAKLNPSMEIRPVFRPIHMQEVYKKAHYFGRDCAETIFREGFLLPSGKGSEDINLINCSETD